MMFGVTLLSAGFGIDVYVNLQDDSQSPIFFCIVI